MATATKTTRSLALTCPLCGTDESEITLDLNDLSSCYCNGCGGQFTPAKAVELLTKQLERWRGVVAWISAAPVD